MKRLLTIVIVLGAAQHALAWPPWSAPETPQKPHPAVVRVIAAENNGMSLGSGTLVGVNEKHGLVITNFHVVRDCTGPMSVVFPDGFMSPAWILKVDRVWDLAALGIQRPNIEPVPLSTQPPRPGEPLTIAGYGPKGVYRAVAGRCTNYFSPGGGNPREWVEVSVSARQGDSGGPIFNNRGELAGVLFGSNMAITMGSYCGRVRGFLASVDPNFRAAPGAGPTMIARQPPAAPVGPTCRVGPEPQAGPIATASPPPRTAGNNGMVERWNSGAVAAASPPPRGTGGQPEAVATRLAAPEAKPPVETTPRPSSPPLPPSEPPKVAASPVVPLVSGVAAVPAAQPPPSVSVASPAQVASSELSALPSRGEQLKTILAAIGVIAVLFHAIRLVGVAAG